MFKNHFIHYVFLLTFLCFNAAFANEKEADTTDVSGGGQVVVSPINILLDLGESASAEVLVLDEGGNPVEGKEIQIVPQDTTKISISSNSLMTNESGYINFSILGKQQGDTVVTITDGVNLSQINIAIKNFIQYLLPYFYGDMQLTLINPTRDINYVKIQFHENGDRDMPPVIIRMEAKEMRNLKLSEEVGVTLKDGWVQITSTEKVFGGVWTNKGYVSVYPVKGSHW